MTEHKPPAPKGKPNGQRRKRKRPHKLGSPQRAVPVAAAGDGAVAPLRATGEVRPPRGSGSRGEQGRGLGRAGHGHGGDVARGAELTGAEGHRGAGHGRAAGATQRVGSGGDTVESVSKRARRRSRRKSNEHSGAITVPVGQGALPSHPSSHPLGRSHLGRSHGRSRGQRARGSDAEGAARVASAAHREPQVDCPDPLMPLVPNLEVALPRRRRVESGPYFAALDLGTNNCRLLIAQPGGVDGFQVVDAFSRIVRLGEGVAETGRLSPAAMERTVLALGICADKMRRWRVGWARAVATEACRRAADGAAFLRHVRRTTGISFDLISPEEEARLAVAGCAPLLDPEADDVLVFDIGGGSTELIWVDLRKTPPALRPDLLRALASPARGSDRARAASAHIADWVSLPVGVVTLDEAFPPHANEAERFQRMVEYVTDLISGFAKDRCAPTPQSLEKLQLIGASGTITTLAGVHLNLARYNRAEVDGLRLHAPVIDAVIERLSGMNVYERAQMPCIGDDRAELVMSGAAILRAILRTWPSHNLRVADRGLREGLLYSLIDQYQSQRAGRNRQPIGVS